MYKSMKQQNFYNELTTKCNKIIFGTWKMAIFKI